MGVREAQEGQSRVYCNGAEEDQVAHHEHGREPRNAVCIPRQNQRLTTGLNLVREGKRKIKGNSWAFGLSK